MSTKNTGINFGVSTTGNGEEWSFRPVVFFGDKVIWSGDYPIRTYDQAMQCAKDKAQTLDPNLLKIRLTIYGSAMGSY